MRSLAPWLWLVDFDAHGKALDASESQTGELAAALMGHFDEVHVLRAEAANLDELRAQNRHEQWAPASAEIGSVRTALWPRETFDCIALHDALARRRLASHELLAELQGAHRLLKPGGWLSLASASPPRLHRLRTHTAGISRTMVSRLLKQANFREIRCFFLEPSVDDPITVVPDVKAAIRARDTLEGVHGKAMWKRRAVTGLGVPSALFSAYLLLARA